MSGWPLPFADRGPPAGANDCSRRSSTASSPAPSHSGITTSSVPGSPKISTAGVTSSGPRAKPALPPSEKMLIPRPRSPRDT